MITLPWKHNQDTDMPTLDMVPLFVIAAVIGVVAGFGSVVLNVCADQAAMCYQEHQWLVFFLPLIGLVEVKLYQACHLAFTTGTVSVIALQRKSLPIPLLLAPAILACSVLTLLGGGSVGKEAAALQMGASLACAIGALRSHFTCFGTIHRYDVAILCGSAAAFSSLLRAPIAAFLFVIEVARPTHHPIKMRHVIAILLASLLGYAVARGCGEPALGLTITPSILAPTVGATAVFAPLAACVGIAFVLLLRLVHTVAHTWIQRPWVRVLCGAGLVIVLYLTMGLADYGGTGDVQITAALQGSTSYSWGFALKAVVTIACLSFGIKDGEIMPCMAIGAMAGCSFAFLTGNDPQLFAALGLLAVFATCAHCPIAAIALGIEWFGWAALPLYVIVCAVAFPLSRSCSFYDRATWDIPLPSWLARGTSQDC